MQKSRDLIKAPVILLNSISLRVTELEEEEEGEESQNYSELVLFLKVVQSTTKKNVLFVGSGNTSGERSTSSAGAKPARDRIKSGGSNQGISSAEKTESDSIEPDPRASDSEESVKPVKRNGRNKSVTAVATSATLADSESSGADSDGTMLGAVDFKAITRTTKRRSVTPE